MGLQSVPTMEALADEALRRMWRFSVNDLMKARNSLPWPGMKKLTGIFQGGKNMEGSSDLFSRLEVGVIWKKILHQPETQVLKLNTTQKTLNLTKLSPWVILKIHWMPVATWKYQPALVGLVCQLVYGFVAVGCRLAPVTIVGCRVSWKLGRCVKDPQGFFSVSSIERSRSNEEDWGRNTETHTLLLPKMSP